MITGDISKTSSITDSEIPNDAVLLAQKLAQRHGNVRITMEEGGIHLYMASPECLRRYGDEELSKMHLAVNSDKYHKNSEDWAALCMKTDKPYTITSLLQTKPLAQRGFVGAQHNIFKKDWKENMELDAQGRWVPKSPGAVLVPLNALPTDHHAVQYVLSRGFDINSLCEQFDMHYSYKERKDVHYRYLGHGFRATPQERIIFYIDVHGKRCGWQARILEFVEDDTKFYFHPYRREWMPVEQKVEGKWHEIEPDVSFKWNPARYIIAHGASRNNVLLGYDAAIRFNKDRKFRVLGLTEGPFDAARLGAPFCAVMGKHFSGAQLNLCKGFNLVVLAMQNDEASEKLKDSVTSRASIHKIQIAVVRPPSEFKDFGDMPTTAAINYLNEALKNYDFQLRDPTG
jgi:hypothetical protein